MALKGTTSQVKQQSAERKERVRCALVRTFAHALRLHFVHTGPRIAVYMVASDGRLNVSQQLAEVFDLDVDKDGLLTLTWPLIEKFAPLVVAPGFEVDQEWRDQ